MNQSRDKIPENIPQISGHESVGVLALAKDLGMRALKFIGRPLDTLFDDDEGTHLGGD
jgi:hypothetical protein